MLEEIKVEVFGTSQKMVAVVSTPTGRVNLQYLVSKDTNKVKLVEAVKVSAEVKGEFYSQTTSKYGETTIMTNNVTDITAKIPRVQDGIDYILVKYPVVTGKPVQIVKTVEYDNEYQLNYVSEVTPQNPLAVVVKINKKTGETS